MSTLISTNISTPLGEMIAIAFNDALIVLDFSDLENLAEKTEKMENQFRQKLISKDSSLFQNLRKQLKEYFKGILHDFDLPIMMNGTDFQKTVWNSLLKIPFGQTSTYGQQARSLNNPKAIRAVARANGQNNLSIIIPCHRIIGQNGDLTGYSGGVWRKKWLLEHECGKSISHNQKVHQYDMFSYNNS